MKYLIVLALVALAYADPIYYKTSGVAPVPAFVRAASPYYKYAAAFPTAAAPAAPGYPVAIAADNTLNLNAGAKVLAFDQASISAPAGYAPASFAPASFAPYYKSFAASAAPAAHAYAPAAHAFAPAAHAFAPAATRVFTAAAFPALDAAASVFPAAVEAEDSLTAAVKSQLALEQANFGVASSYAPYYKSIMGAAPANLAAAPVVAVTEFAPAATRVFAPAGAAATNVIQAFSPAAAMAEFAPAATRVFAPAGAAATHAIHAFSPAAAMTEFAPAATRVFAPAGFSAGAASNYAVHAFGPAAAAASYAPAATRFFAPSAYPAAAAASPAVYLADSDAYKINHPSPIVKVLSYA
ncbi:hypothetical protein J6590_000905 [Homalodisca vitripennis]|nr:hypothetical protein J6590_000905 [Homalodisca vitripennis]